MEGFTDMTIFNNPGLAIKIAIINAIIVTILIHIAKRRR